jgi:hypothetical protein
MERSGGHNEPDRCPLEEFQGTMMLFARVPHVVCFVDSNCKKGVAEEGVLKGSYGSRQVPRPIVSRLLLGRMKVVVHFFEQNLQC